jgi:D-3-phosphoglycerate dehydrogenase
LAVGCFCIGTNQVDLESANRRGIPVFNAPFSNTRSVAEMIMAEIIMLARHLGDRSREMHAGAVAQDGDRLVRGPRQDARHRRLRPNRSAGGRHRRDPRPAGDLLRHHGTLPMGNNRLKTLDELLAESDYVTLHVPETHADARHDLDARSRVDEARGVPPQREPRHGGRHRRAGGRREEWAPGRRAIDVFPEEPETNSDGFVTPLQTLPNVVMTPHIGGSTAEAQEAIGREVGAALVKFVNAGVTTGAVNFPNVDSATPGKHRILNVHKNVPGVLRDINHIVSDKGANIAAQVLATDANIGYLVMDIDQDVSLDVKNAIAALKTSLKTRILY